MRVDFLLLLLSIFCYNVINGADTYFKKGRYGNIGRSKSRNYIVKCCSYESCLRPASGSGSASRNIPNNTSTKMPLITETAIESDETEATPDTNDPITHDITKVAVVTTLMNSAAKTTSATENAVTTTNNPNTNNAPTITSSLASYTVTSSSLVISSTSLTTITQPITAAPITVSPASALSTTAPPTTLASTTASPTTTTPTTPTTMSPLCVQPCPTSCDCNGDGLVLDAEGEITSETITGNFILKCGKQVNTTAYYHSKPNVTNFNNTEMVCCSVCAITAGKSSSGKRKRAVTPECLTDFQNVYLENVNGSVKVEFSVAGERGDCAFLAGSNVTITWNPIKLCSPTVKFFGSNKTACSVINSWLSCGNQIQNQKLPADPYCQLFGPATCGQSATYQCTASNNVTIFQSLTQGLLFERVSNWAYFRQENFAEWTNFDGAFTYCENHMMDLATFETMAELDAVLQWHQAWATQTNGTTATHAYIGIDHIAVPMNFVITKTGLPAVILKWTPTEPSGFPAEKCVCLIANYPATGQNGMEDLPCDVVTQFICKVRPEFVWTVKML